MDKKSIYLRSKITYTNGVSDQKEWYLKDEQGRRFGPVAWETVVQWAADGRVSPLYSLSQDGQLWSRATNFPLLGMTWLAELSPGKFYGPLPLPAIKGLIAEGSIPANVRLYQLQVDEDVPHARDVETSPQLRDLHAKPDEANTRIQSLDQALADTVSRSSALEQRLADEQAQHAKKQAGLETELDSARRNAAALEQRLADEQAQHAKKQAGLEAELDSARRNAAALEQRLADEQAQRTKEQAAFRSERDDFAREKQALLRQTATVNSRFTAQQQHTVAAEQKAAALSLNLAAVTRERDALREKLDKQTAQPPEVSAEEVVVEVLPPDTAFGTPSNAENPNAHPGGRQTPASASPPFGGDSKLAVLEAQVQRELAALQASGKMPDFLKR